MYYNYVMYICISCMHVSTYVCNCVYACTYVRTSLHLLSVQLSCTSGSPSLSESSPHVTPLPANAGLVH